MTNYPIILDELIKKQNVDQILNQMLRPLIQDAINTPSNIIQLQHIIYRLLDPHEEHEDIIEIDDLVNIAITLAPILSPLTPKSETSLASKQIIYQLQGLILWFGTSASFSLIRELLIHEYEWRQNPTKEFVENPDQSNILKQIDSFLKAFKFIHDHILEHNRNYKHFHLIFNYSYAYYLRLKAYHSYFGEAYIDSCLNFNACTVTTESLLDLLSTMNLQLTTTLASTASSLLATSTSPTLDPITSNITLKTSYDKANIDNNLPSWLLYDKVIFSLTQLHFDTFYFTLRLLPILPSTPFKIKMLSFAINNRLFGLPEMRKKLDSTFLNQQNFGPFLSLIVPSQNATSSSSSPQQQPQLIPQRELYITMIPLSLCTIIDKLASYQLLSKYELSFFLLISRVPIHTIQQLTHSRLEYEQLLNNDQETKMSDNNNTNNLEEQSCFKNNLVTTFIQHNITSIGTFTSSISFQQLCLLLGLDEQTHLSNVQELLRKMILNNQLTQYQCKIDELTNMVKFLRYTNSPYQFNIEIAGTKQQNMLKEVYNSTLDGTRYVQ